MSSRILLFVGTLLAVVLSFAGCLDTPETLSMPDPGETTTLTDARITRDGAALLIRGTSNGVAASVRSSEVTFEDDSAVGGAPSIIPDGCYKCVCTENACVCRPVDCP